MPDSLTHSPRARDRACTSAVSQEAAVGFYFFFSFYSYIAAYGRSQARAQTRAAAASLYHSHGNSRSEPHLWPIPQLTATYTIAHTRSLTHWMRPGIKPASSWVLAGFVTVEPQGELLEIISNEKVFAGLKESFFSSWTTVSHPA